MSRREILHAGGDANLLHAQQSEERAIQNRAGQQRRDDRRRFAVRVRQPRVHRRETHFGAVANEEQHAGDLQPRRLQLWAWLDQFRKHQGKPSAVRLDRGHAEEEIGQQRQRNADGTNQKIFPRRFERAVMPVEINQGRAGQRGSFNGNPDQAEMLADGHERHRRQKQKQAADKNRFRRVVEQKPFLRVRVVPVRFLAEIARGINGRDQKQAAGDAQEQQARRIQSEPAVERRRRHGFPAHRRQHRVQQRRADEQAATHGRSRQAEGQQTGERGNEDEGENHFDCGLRSADCGMNVFGAPKLHSIVNRKS